MVDEVDSITHVEVVWMVHWSLSQELLQLWKKKILFISTMK